MGPVLRFLGATGTVTGSRTLVSAGGTSVLVDCGLFQGFKALRLRNWSPWPLDPAALDAVVLTHAHIDHSGALPLLVRQGFRGPVYCTPATLELCRILLPDSAGLQEEQAQHANRHGWSKHRPALPLYTRHDAERALSHLRAVPFGKPFDAGRGIQAAFSPAGHILGAASVLLRAQGRSVLFSGDLGRPDDPVMRPPAPPPAADAVVMESTYGDRLHAKDDGPSILAAVVNRTVSRGGTVVIPAFAVGRAQLLVHELASLQAAGRLPASLPIFVDSPMATDVTALYRRHRDEHRLDDAACAALTRAVRHVEGPEESKALDASDYPMVILAGSGMATGGRVLHHIRRFAPDPRSTVLFAGFQAGGTRGAAMVAGAPEVKMFGGYVPVRAEVVNLDSLSAHADREELLGWLGALPRIPARLFLNHGEPSAADTLRRAIAERLGWTAEVAEFERSCDV